MCVPIQSKKNQIKSMLLWIIKIIFLATKVFVSQQDQNNYHRKLSQSSYLAQKLTKTQNHI